MNRFFSGWVVQTFQLNIRQNQHIYTTDLWWSDSRYHPVLPWRGGKRSVQGWSEIGFPPERDQNWWLLLQQTGLRNPPINQESVNKAKSTECNALRYLIYDTFYKIVITRTSCLLCQNELPKGMAVTESVQMQATKLTEWCLWYLLLLASLRISGWI